MASPAPITPGLLGTLRLREPRGEPSPEETAVPIGFLSDAERERLDGFPAQVVPGDIETYFTLSRADRRQIPRTTSPANRLGFALQLGTLRFLGFCPDDLSTAPEAVVAFVARQLDVAPGELARYGRRGQTRTEHLRQIRRYLGFRKATAGDLARLESWLVDRALEHDRPTLLLRLACEHLLGLRIERPGVTHLERLIAAARQRAQQETYRRLAPILTGDCKARLDGLLTVDAATGRSRLAWLQQSAATYTPPTILVTLEKRACCRRWGVDRWDVSSLSPNRLKFLAQIARRSTNQALQRMPEQRRYPILVAFLYQTLIDLTDEALDLFDRCLAEAYHRASRDLEDFRLSVARSTNEKVRLFREIGRVVLDPKVKDADLRRAIYRRIPPAELRDAVEESDRIIRPLDDHYFDFLESRYTYLRQFTPEFIDAIAFRVQRRFGPDQGRGPAPSAQRRTTARPARRDAARVRPRAVAAVRQRQPRPDGRRHYFELCVLWELRGALRAGDVWLEGSRRYADPETYLIPREEWPGLRAEVCREIQAPEDGTDRLREREQELSGLLDRVEALLAKGGDVRMEGDDLVVSPLEAEAEAGEHGGAGTTHRRAAAAGRAERAAHRGRRLDALQRRLRARRRDGAAEPRAAEPPLCGGPRPGVQPRPDPHGADLRPDLPEAGLVHELVRPRRDPEGRDDAARQLPVPPAAEPVLGQRDAVLVRRPAVPRLRQGADGHGPAAVLRLRQGGDLLHLDRGPVLAVRHQGHPRHGAGRDLRARRDPRQRDRAADPGAHDRHGGLHRDRLRPVRPAGPAVLPADPRPGRPAAVPHGPPEATPPPGASARGADQPRPDPAQLGRPAAGGRVAEARLGHRVAADRQAPVLPPQEPADPGPAGVRPPGQDDLHPPLPGERATTGGGSSASSTRARPCTACGSSCCSPTRARCGRSRRRS